MIRRLTLKNFKGFDEFAIRFGKSAYLSGPNSAGKSTLLAALRATSQLQKIALSRVADVRVNDMNSTVPAWSFTPQQARLNVENLRHDFRDEDSSIRVSFSNGSSLKAVWPKGDIVPSEGWFYFQSPGGIRLSRPAEVRREIPSLGFVPLLTPIEQQERVLQGKTVRSNLDTRLSSRHFRNQLRLMQETAGREEDSALQDFLKFAEPWLPELEIRDVVSRAGRGGPFLDLFYFEEGGKREMEIYWIGDGMQIWLQVLLHLFRLSNESTIVLDEPDVYLHPDLQRRLVRLLDSFEAQTITATHSAEVLAEASDESIAWISRNREHAVSAASNKQLAQLTSDIGSQFNIRLARALKARAVLFVEGEDSKILTNLAAACGGSKFANELGLAVVPLNGFDNWEHVEPFAWFANNLLLGSVPVTVLLDRDYRPPRAVTDVVDRLTTAGVNAHVWEQKELENYLLVPSAIARLSGSPESRIREILDDKTRALENQVSARLLDERHRYEVDASHHRVSITERFNEEFRVMWGDLESRMTFCCGKDLLSAVNRALDEDGFQTVSSHALSHAIKMDEIAPEMRDVIAHVEGLLA